jgi:hypothetical protein
LFCSLNLVISASFDFISNWRCLISFNASPLDVFRLIVVDGTSDREAAGFIAVFVINGGNSGDNDDERWIVMDEAVSPRLSGMDIPLIEVEEHFDDNEYEVTVAVVTAADEVGGDNGTGESWLIYSWSGDGGRVGLGSAIFNKIDELDIDAR